MRLELPKDLRDYDPFDLAHREQILEHFKVKVYVSGDPENPRVRMGPTWVTSGSMGVSP